MKSNIIFSIEQHVDWITDCIEFMQAKGMAAVEAEQGAETQ